MFKELLHISPKTSRSNYLARLGGQVILSPFYRRENKTQSGHMAGYVVRKLWLLGLEARPPTFQSRTLYTLLKLKVALVNDQIKSCPHICQKPTVRWWTEPPF